MVVDSPKTSHSRKLLLPALALVLAGSGQMMLNRSMSLHTSPLFGWVLYAIAAILFAIAFRHSTVAQHAFSGLSDIAAAAPPRLSRPQWILGALAIAAMLASLVPFGSHSGEPFAWKLHIASVLVFIAAFIPFARLKRPALPSARQFSVQLLRALPILAVLALATFARMWQLSEFPYGEWTDEAFNGLAAMEILKDASFRPVYLDTTQMPSHFNYLVASSFTIFGASPLGVRLVAAAFGILAVLFTYLLFRRWFGSAIAVVAACLLAVMRYHLTFSRFGMQGIATPTFELAALYFLDRALANRKLSDFAWLGLSIGFGLAFYFAFRLFPIVLMLFLIGMLIAAIGKYGLRETNTRYIKGLLPHWLVALLALLIALAPVAQFAVRNNEAFLQRTGMTSLFKQRDEPNLAKAYWNNLSKHLLMFNVKGDNNGRHNLPGAPMLDPVMGVLFILGLAYAIWHWRDPANSLMLLLFLIMLHGGVLSLDFEAPQSLRSIGIIPALIYFIILPIANIAHTIGQGVEQRANIHELQPKPSLGSGSPFLSTALRSLCLLAVLALVTYLNFDMFFNKQKNDPSAWAQYSTAETIVANEMNQRAASNDFVISANYDGYPTVRFLAGSITNYQRWTSTDRLPLVHEDNGHGIVMMFDEKLLSAYNDAKRIYPAAQFIEHHAPTGGGIVMYEAILTPDDLRAVSGAVARYYTGTQAQGQPAKEEALAQLAVDWTTTKPLAPPFVAQLQTTLHISEYGDYSFSLRGPPGARVWIDENLVADAPIKLARGNHALRLQLPDTTQTAELWWQQPQAPEAQAVPRANLFRPPVTNSGLLGTYYPTPDWSGEPAFTQIDPELAFYFHIVPLPRPYSVEWKGKLFAPQDGTYIFALNSVDGAQLTLDQRAVVENPGERKIIEGTVQLAQGWHDINVHFSDKTSGTQIYLYWTPPGASERELIPSRYLLPPMGQYPPNVQPQP